MGHTKRLILVLVLLLASVLPVAGQTATDPRTPNAQAFHVNSAGLVDGVELVYDEYPDSAYQLVQARLIDEASAGGATVATYVVIDCYGVPVSENVYLAWPYPELNGGQLLPGNQSNQHMITNGYSPPNRGPLAIFIGDAQGRRISDVIGGLGLPFNRHVSFYLAFKRRCGPVATPTPTATPGPEVTPTPVPVGDLTVTNDLLRQILEVLKALAGHLGTY